VIIPVLDTYLKVNAGSQELPRGRFSKQSGREGKNGGGRCNNAKLLQCQPRDASCLDSPSGLSVDAIRYS
jgi:hypothetical protein